jgi:hypothetical protein
VRLVMLNEIKTLLKSLSLHQALTDV